MMTNEEKLTVCMEFRDRMVTMLKEVSNMAQCVIPLNDDDKKILTNGISEIDLFVEELKKADSLRELDQYFHVDEYLSQYEEIDDAAMSSVTHQRFTTFMESIERMVSDDE